MSGERQTLTPVRVVIHGLNPGESPWVEIAYEDGRDTVQRILDGSDETTALIAAALDNTVSV